MIARGMLARTASPHAAQPLLCQRLDAIVALHGDALAIVDGARRVSYRDLGAAVEALARLLLATDTDTDTDDDAPIAVLVPVGAALAIATFAVLKLGRPCVSLDSSMPPPRREQILHAAGATLVVTCMDSTADAATLPAFNVQRRTARHHAATGSAPTSVNDIERPALVLYTSGSTGEPKGVVYTHAAILERIVDSDRFQLAAGDRIGVFGSAGMNLFRALLNGAALCSWDVASEGIAGIGDWIESERITLLHCIPTLFRQWVGTLAGHAYPSLRCVSLTGEPVVARDVRAFLHAFPAHCSLANGFGTTESGTCCQFVIHRATDTIEAMVPVGYAVAGIAIRIVDDAGIDVATGAQGEIVVEGKLLSSGYWRNPAAASSRFGVTPDGVASYRTGDIGCLRADGALVHLGRIDQQVKIRGVRVEVAEVEAVLHAHPQVRQAAVAGRTCDSGELRLIACIAAHTWTPDLPTELARFVRERLPDAMVPDGWTFVDALPVTPRGKIDRRALPDPPPRRFEIHGPGLVEQFAREAARCGSAVAFRDATHTLTFAQLERRSAALAVRLTERSIGAGDVVALALPRSVNYAVALLAVLRVGAACMPIDANGPRERNATMLLASGAVALIAAPEMQRILGGNLIVIDPSDECANEQDAAQSLPRLVANPERLAFVIHTSGSTGIPKGVEISERQVLHRLNWDCSARPFAHGEVACQRGTPGFVDTIAEWLGPLLCGVPTLIVDDALLLRPRDMIEALASACVTRILLVPSQLEMLLDADANLGRELPALRLWTCSGEPLRGRSVERFREALPAAQLWNVYGATEAWDATCHRVEAADDNVPIGRPLPGMRIYVLDDRMAPVATGVAGELYVAGDGLARGYRGDPALTRERFVDNPFSPGNGDRLYRTGDRVRVRDDGLLECLGRSDRRIKVNGVRIELGEIEAAVASHVAVREVAVVHVDGRIVAHIAPSVAATVDPMCLREFIRERLPASVLPHAIVMHVALPRNERGKIDRALLQAPSRDIEVPRNELEQVLVDLFVDVLGRAPLGATDDFFDQGGDSLLAVRLAAGISACTGITFPLRVLAEARTPRAIAAALGQHWAEWTSTRIVLHAGGTQPPLFALAGAWGYAMRMLTIGHKLSNDIPFHALQPPMMQWPRHASLPAMATHYVREMLRVSPRGPHRIVGTSFGGIMAFEIALQLQAQGHAPPVLFVIDSQVPGSTLTPDESPDRPLSAPEAVGRSMYLAHIAAANAYRPGGIAEGRAIYFRCATTRRTALRQWQRLLRRPMEIIAVPGVHGEYHRQPQLGAIVLHLCRTLAADVHPGTPCAIRTSAAPPATWQVTLRGDPESRDRKSHDD
ncbi:MAG: amino acid adenylation domain-containing protein [Casimicrobiaceae bacterium]